MNVRSLDLASIAHGFMTGLHYLSEYLAANTQIVLFQMLGLAGQFWDGQKKKGFGCRAKKRLKGTTAAWI